MYLIGSGLVDAAFSYSLFTTLNTTVFIILSVSFWTVCVMRDFLILELGEPFTGLGFARPTAHAV